LANEIGSLRISGYDPSHPLTLAMDNVMFDFKVLRSLLLRLGICH